MTHERAMRIVEMGLAAALVGCLLVALFTFEFSIPQRGMSGVAVCLLPRWGTQALEALPVGYVGESQGGEWGGSLTYLRQVIVQELFVISATLCLLIVIRKHRARWRARAGLGLLFAAALIMCPRAFTSAYANYDVNLFALGLTWLGPSDATIVPATWAPGPWQTLVPPLAVRLRETSSEWFPAALLVAAGTAGLLLGWARCDAQLEDVPG